MPRSLPLLSAISIILVAIIGIQLLLPEYGLVNVGLHLTAGKPQTQNTQHNKSYADDFLCPVSDGEPTLKYGTECYRSDMFT
jgi:hypothetical protein